MAKSNLYHNMQVMRNGIKAFMHKNAKPMILEGLIRIAVEIAQEIRDGKYNIPEFTGNLFNSTGVAVYGFGQLKYYSPIRDMTNPPYVQSASSAITGGPPKYNIVGAQLLRQAMAEELAIQTIDGLYLVIFAAVPYAWYINEFGSPLGRGQGFYDQMMGYSLGEKLRHYIFRKTNSKTLDLTDIITTTGVTASSRR